MGFFRNLGKSISGVGKSIEQAAEQHERNSAIEDYAKVCRAMVHPDNEVNLNGTLKDNARDLMLKPICWGLNNPGWFVVPSTVDLRELVSAVCGYCYNSSINDPATEIKKRLTQLRSTKDDTDYQLISVNEVAPRQVILVQATTSRRVSFVDADERRDYNSTDGDIQRVSLYWIWIDKPSYLDAYLSTTDIWNWGSTSARYDPEAESGDRHYDVDCATAYFYADVNYIDKKGEPRTSGGYFYFNGMNFEHPTIKRWPP